VDAVANEKGVSKEIIFGALEIALASAAKKRYPGDPDVQVTINRRSGVYETFRRWQVVPTDAPRETPERQMSLTDARQIRARGSGSAMPSICLWKTLISVGGSLLRPPGRSLSRKCGMLNAPRLLMLFRTARVSC
jgi:hypothetical protein